MPFQCSICGEESTRICARCTKDACNNHLCEKCRRCSDCCECEVALSEPVRSVFRSAAAMPKPDPKPQPHQPPPEPDPFPDDEELPGPVEA
jgi:hypothetical protein